MTSADDVERTITEMQPLILLGMHRSGTSLMVRLLADVGVHMGRRLSRDAEDIFFQKLNRRIYGALGVRWGYVAPLLEAMRNPRFVDRQTERMRRALFSSRRPWSAAPGIVDFFGATLWQRVQEGEPLPWGWKDPRTSLTFPIWLQIFPRARVVHVLRNGIDVAISTHRRSQKQQARFWTRTLKLDYCPITLDFQYCFQLWEEHVSFVLEHRRLIPDEQYLEVRYEELLAAPVAELDRITSFIGYPLPEPVLRAACQRVDQTRLDNSRYAAPYLEEISSLASSSLMQQLGYEYG
ncbi:MAG: sulfotransferase [Chloroflexota bacterium]